MSGNRSGHRGSLVARLVGLYTLGALGVFLLLGVSVMLMLRNELMARDREELDGKTAVIEHHLADVTTTAQLSANLKRFEDTAVGHTQLQLGVAANGRWLRRPGDGVAELLGGRDIDSVPTGPGFEVLRDGERTWWVRRVSHRVADGTGGQVHAIVAVNIAHAVRVQERFNVALWVIGITGILLMAALAWWATRRGLSPLERIAADAQRVTAERLGEPLAIEQAPEEIRGVVAGINRMLARLADSFRSLEQFSADIAHELRTPLNSLMLRVEVTLSRERSTDEYRDALLDTKAELEHLHKTVTDMLFIARAERGMTPLRTETVDLRAEAHDAIEYFEPLASERSLTSTVTGEAKVRGDRLMVRRAITNLLSNAVRYSHDGSTITVGIDSDARAVRLVVRNRCEPLSRAQIDHLFDRFARGDAAREREPEGSGLGLAIVRSIMTLHGGSVLARSDDGFLEFELSWPVAPDAR